MKDEGAVGSPRQIISVYGGPARLPEQTGALFKIDGIATVGKTVVISGWSTCDAFRLYSGTGPDRIEFDVVRHIRADVNRAVVGDPSAQTGFLAVSDLASESGQLVVDVNGHEYEIDKDGAPRLVDFSALGAPIFRWLRGVRLGSRSWRDLMSIMPAHPRPGTEAAGHLDAAVNSPVGGAATGWLVASDDALVWLEDDGGGIHSLDEAYRWNRIDILERAIATVGAAHQSGFVAELRGVGTATELRLHHCTQRGRAQIASLEIKRVPMNAKALARELFSFNTPLLDFAGRVRRVDLPLLAEVNEHAKAASDKAVIERRRFGTRTDDPEVSIIIPIYGRLDMAEIQLLEFRKDEEIGRTAELIFVVDDPTLIHDAARVFPTHHKVIGTPFSLVWNGVNNGYSGACNIGAAQAAGDRFIFLNSDAFPIGPGWWQELSNVLDDPEIGMVAPRLLFPDGSIQHAGMLPHWRSDLRLWTNRHPLMGMDVSFDPAKTVVDATLVTGACVAMRRDVFEEIGGWSTDYLFGDFEDSDLCFRVRQSDRRVAYCPNVELHHLERQSVLALGSADFRTKVTLFNAVRYNDRWRDELSELAS